MVADSFFIECLFKDYQRLKMLNQLLSDEDNLSQMEVDDILEESFRLIHTIKETLGFLKYNKEMQKVHELESYYLQLIKHPTNKDEIYYSNLKVEQALTLVLEKVPHDNEQFQYIDLNELLCSIKQEMDKQNQMEGKDIQIIVIASEGKIHQSVAKDVYQLTYQILKNAIAHGYFHKKMIIKMNGTMTSSHLKLKITNDGLTIDYFQLLKEAKNKTQSFNSLEEVVFLNQVTTKSVRDEMAGSGMGLSVVQKIVEKYRGKIKILNQEDLTGFYLDLPLKEAFDFLKQQ